MTRRWTTAALSVIPVVFLGYLFVWPVSRILATAGLSGFAEVIGDPRLRASAWFTLWQAGVSTVATVLIALPLTSVISRFSFPGRSLVRAAVTVPFVLPTVVVGAAFLALGVEGSALAIIVAHVFYNLAIVVRTVGSVWSRIDPAPAEAARTLGASRWRAFREITLPLLRPSIAAAASLVFLFSFTSFGVVLILGGLRYRTIEVEIYQQAVTFLDLPTAGALALAQLVGIALVLVLYTRSQERRAVRFKLIPESASLHRPATGGQWALVFGVVAVTLGAQLTPLAVLVGRSLRGGTAGWAFLASPGNLAVRPLEAIGNTLLFAGVAAAIALTIGLLSATVLARSRGQVSRWFDIILMLPLGTSAVTIGFGFLVALDRPIDLRGTLVLVPLAHALVAIPFVVRATLPTLRTIREELRDAAAVLGASPSRVWREVDLPIVARAAAVGAGFAAAISIGEFGATSFIVRPDTITVPTLIFRLLGRPGAVTYTGAMALAVILMVVTAALILAVDRVRSDALGDF